MMKRLQTHRVVIVGASIAGLTAAETLRAEGFSGDILLIGAEPDLPYARPPLSKQVLLGSWTEKQAVLRSEADLAALGVRLCLGAAAEGLDLVERRVHVAGGSVSFDELIIATGVTAHIPGPFTSQADVQSLRTMKDARVLREKLDTASRVIVLGAGVLGSEIASAARAQEREVVLVGRSSVLSFGSVGPSLSSRLMRLHHSHGVETRLGSPVLDVRRRSNTMTVELAAGSVLEGDLVVAATGGTPATAWLRGSELNITNGVLCDEQGLAAPGVYAVGDVARWADPLTQMARRIEHQTNAIEQAIAVANSIIHGAASTERVPFFWSEIHGTRIQAYGMFDGRASLRPLDPSRDEDHHVLASGDGGTVRGIIGWNAAKAFRQARKLVDASLQQSVTRPRTAISAHEG